MACDVGATPWERESEMAVVNRIILSLTVFDFSQRTHGPDRSGRFSATQIQTPLFSTFLFSFIFHFHTINTIIKTHVNMIKIK